MPEEIDVDESPTYVDIGEDGTEVSVVDGDNILVQTVEENPTILIDESNTTVLVDDTTIILELDEDFIDVVEVGTLGPPGPPGVDGQPGPQGVPGVPGEILTGTGDLYYEYVQAIAASIWTIPHPLGKVPSVTVIDTGDTEIIGDVTTLTDTLVVIQFSSPFTGKAYLN